MSNKIEDIFKRNFSDISEEYKAFCYEKDKCEQCDIFENYMQVVQSEGNGKNPTFMFVGESPGVEESKEIRPFIGRAGQRLRQELRKWSNVFEKGNTIITNVLSCRPFENKFPEPQKQGKNGIITDKADACMKLWLEREIDILKPKVIVALGAISLRYIFGSSQKISEHRGDWEFLLKYKAMGFSTYHPSYVLRCLNDSSRIYNVKLFEQDIEKVATTWQTMVAAENRMRMSDEKYKRLKTAEKLKEKFGNHFDLE